MTTEERVWVGWPVAVLCSFAFLELTMPTKLCTALRRWLRIHPQRRGHRLAGTALALLLAWFLAHILDQHQDEP